MVHEALQGFGRLWPGDQQVEVADCILAAPQAAGSRDLIQAAGFRQIRNQFVGGFLAEAQQESAGALAVLRDGFEDLLLKFRAHARKLAQFLLLADPFQIVDGGHFVMLVKQRDALRSQALDAQQLEQGSRVLLEQMIALLKCSALADFLENRRDAFTNAGDIGDLAFGIAQDIVNAFRIAFYGGRGVAIAADAKAILGANFHQVGYFGKQPRDFTIFHACCLRLYPACEARRAPGRRPPNPAFRECGLELHWRSGGMRRRSWLDLRPGADRHAIAVPFCEQNISRSPTRQVR